MHPGKLLRDFKIVIRNAGLPVIRFHDLRHTAASLMLNNEIAPIIVSRRVGHARASDTEYAKGSCRDDRRVNYSDPVAPGCTGYAHRKSQPALTPQI
jgi:integrase